MLRYGKYSRCSDLCSCKTRKTNVVALLFCRFGSKVIAAWAFLESFFRQLKPNHLYLKRFLCRREAHVSAPGSWEAPGYQFNTVHVQKVLLPNWMTLKFLTFLRDKNHPFKPFLFFFSTVPSRYVQWKSWITLEEFTAFRLFTKKLRMKKLVQTFGKGSISLHQNFLLASGQWRDVTQWQINQVIKLAPEEALKPRRWCKYFKQTLFFFL